MTTKEGRTIIADDDIEAEDRLWRSEEQEKGKKCAISGVS
jgi:hypothetical protein